MKKLNSIESAIFLLTITLLLGMQSCNNSHSHSFSYQLDPGVFSSEILLIEQVTPDEAMEWMFDSSLAVFIDIRSNIEYDMGHLENAINIPQAELLDGENKTLFDNWLNDSLKVVLYGKDELQANSPWMLLYQSGYSNMRVLMGGYSYIDRLYLDQLEEGETYMVEDPQFDFAAIIKDVQAEKDKPKEIAPPPKKVVKKQEVVVQKKEKKPAEGGC